MKIKKKKASILAVAMIILGIMLITALSVSVVSIKERKASMGEVKSGQAFQNAQSGLEAVLQDMLKRQKGYVSQLNDCKETGKISSSGYTVELFKKDNTEIPCNDPNAKIFNVAYIKSAGTDSGQQRSIQAKNICADANIEDEMVGHWAFDELAGPMVKAVDDIHGNNAIPCTNAPLAPCRADGKAPNGGACIPHPEVNSVPVIVSGSGEGRSSNFISFNKDIKTEKNCAMIANAPDYDLDGKNDYQLQEGTVSFWFRYHSSIPSGTSWAGVFSKDANGCDTNSNPDYPLDNYTSVCWSGTDRTESHCDCGQWTLSYHYPIEDKLGIRFQNDGNSSHYALGSEVDIGDGDWHLVDLTFDAEKYIFYVDGIKGKEFRETTLDDTDPADPISDFDSKLEALTGNKWRIWLGATYGSNYSESDMDDLRIYKKALTQCEVTRLYAETK